MSEPGSQPLTYSQFSSQGWERISGVVIVERTVSLTVNGQPWLSFQCTPTQLEELAVGFLFNEGIVQSPADIADVRECENGDNVDVWLHKEAVKPVDWRRTSGCSGGITSVDESISPQTVAQDGTFSPEDVFAGMQALFQSQEIYRQARGIHCSALSGGSGLDLLAEDIGRHNTLDKLAGAWLLQGRPFIPRMVFTTGRISSEMLQKSARLGVQLVASRTAASSMAVASAESLGITLVSYARRLSFNVYTHPERMQGALDGAVPEKHNGNHSPGLH